MIDDDKFKRMREYYDQDYYSDGPSRQTTALPWHCRWIARRLGSLAGKDVLDVACGRGEWLEWLHSKGANISGIDLSERAIDSCRRRMPGGDFRCGVAETLPFESASFDIVTCLGSLEHFLDKPGALHEMVRVARPDALFLILVPNAGFLTRRLGLYKGTNQARVQEDVLSLEVWHSLLVAAGLQVRSRWRDLHPLSLGWIGLGRGIGERSVRILQAAALGFWPIRWQYQVYHFCQLQAAR